MKTIPNMLATYYTFDSIKGAIKAVEAVLLNERNEIEYK